MGQERVHSVFNVYGEDAVDIVEGAVEAAMEDGAETRAEAVERIARAYTGYL